MWCAVLCLTRGNAGNMKLGSVALRGFTFFVGHPSAEDNVRDSGDPVSKAGQCSKQVEDELLEQPPLVSCFTDTSSSELELTDLLRYYAMGCRFWAPDVLIPALGA